MSPSDWSRIHAEVMALAPRAKILAVSKTQTPEAVIALARQGQRDFGENYVQELVSKAQAVRQLAPELEIRWHLIGHLQTNKVKQVLPWVSSIQSVDSVRLAQEITKRLPPGGRFAVFLQVNCDAETSKSGFSPDGLRSALPELLALKSTLHFMGLMVIPKPASEGGNPRQAFERTRQLERELQAAGLTQGELSMGMSADYREALGVGSTWVRLGTALFGAR